MSGHPASGKWRWSVLGSAIALVIALTATPAHGRYFVTQWGGFGKGPGQFDGADGVAADAAGNVYVADEFNHRVQKFTSSGEFITEWDVFTPEGVDTDSAGNVYVTDTLEIQKFTSSGEFITAWKPRGALAFEFFAADVAIDAAGNGYVADSFNDRVYKFAPSGKLVTRWGRNGQRPGRFDSAEGIATDSRGNVYVADFFNDRVQKFTSSGKFITKWGVFLPRGVDTDSAGNVYVASTSEIQKFTSSGKFITKWGRSGAGPGEFCATGDVTTDSAANVYVTDAYNRVQKFSQTTGSQASGGGPRPVAGVSLGICNTSGVIKVKCRGDRKFRQVEFGELIPVGCLVNARRGSVKLTSARGGERTQSALFQGGLFRVSQEEGRNPYVTLTLAGSLKCGRGGARRGDAALSKKGGRIRGRTRRSLHRVEAQQSVTRTMPATRTAWLVADRCDGTTVTKVREGAVRVRDFALGLTFTVKAGEKYVAGP